MKKVYLGFLAIAISGISLAQMTAKPYVFNEINTGKEVIFVVDILVSYYDSTVNVSSFSATISSNVVSVATALYTVFTTNNSSLFAVIV